MQLTSATTTDPLLKRSPVVESAAPVEKTISITFASSSSTVGQSNGFATAWSQNPDPFDDDLPPGLLWALERRTDAQPLTDDAVRPSSGEPVPEPVARDLTWNPALLFSMMARSDLDHLGGVIADPSTAQWLFRLNLTGNLLSPSLVTDLYSFTKER